MGPLRERAERKDRQHEALHPQELVLNRFQELVLNRLPPDMKTRCKFLTPFLQSHALSLEVLGGAGGYTKTVCDELKMNLARDPMHVRGQEVRVATETSPTRRALLKTWYYNRDIAQSLDSGDKICVCERALEIYDVTQRARIGWIDRVRNSWVWNRRAAATAGVTLPQDMDKDPEQNRHDDTKEEEKTDAKDDHIALQVPDDEFEDKDMDTEDIGKENREPIHGAPPAEGEAEAKKQRALRANATL